MNNIRKYIECTLLIGVLLLSGCTTSVDAPDKSNGEPEYEIIKTEEEFTFSYDVFYAKPSVLNEGSQARFDKLSYLSEQRPTVAYMPPGTEFDYYIAIGEGIKSYAQEMGVDMFMAAPESGSDIEGQMLLLEDVISQKVDAIILSTHDEKALASLIKKGVDQGIEVIIVNSDILEFPTPVHGVVGYDQRKGTKKLGDYVVELVKDKNIDVGMIEGQAGWHSTQRIGGFVDAIGELSNFNIVASLDGQWNVEGGQSATLEMFQAHKQIELIFAANDYEIIGAVKAIESLGLEGVLLFGNDGDTACLEEIAAGNVEATVNTDPFHMGKIALQVAMDGLANKFFGGYVETPTIIVDRENVLDYLQNPESLHPKPSKDY